MADNTIALAIQTLSEGTLSPEKEALVKALIVEISDGDRAATALNEQIETLKAQKAAATQTVAAKYDALQAILPSLNPSVRIKLDSLESFVESLDDDLKARLLEYVKRL